MLKVGGLKGFVDGIMGNSSARFYEPYLTSGELGIWRQMMKPEGNMLRLLLLADSSGHWPQVHAIGDRAIDHLLDLFEQVMDQNGPRDRRFRMIHTQVLRGAEVAERMAKLGIIAEVQPYHAIDDMRWMAERIGERSRWAYAFKTLEDAGVVLSFGSDWPGTNASWYPGETLARHLRCHHPADPQRRAGRRLVPARKGRSRNGPTGLHRQQRLGRR